MDRWAALERKVRGAVGKPEELFPELTGRRQLGAQDTQLPQAIQGLSELRTRFDLSTQLPCPRVGVFHIQGCIAADDLERCAKGNLEREFVLVSLRRVGQQRE